MIDKKRQHRFETVVAAYARDLYRYALMLCRNPTLADDLVQETFLRAWRHMDSLRDESKAKSWLITTIRREHARLYERYRPEFEDIDFEHLPTTHPSVEEDVEVLRVREAVARLPDKYRDVLILQIICGCTGNEIAEIVDLPLPTVNTRLFRARQQLRDVLVNTEDDSHPTNVGESN